jgi:hypothetical protein
MKKLLLESQPFNDDVACYLCFSGGCYKMKHKCLSTSFLQVAAIKMLITLTHAL